MTYYYSASFNSFYPSELKEDYVEAGTFPDDSVLVDDDVFLEFSQSIEGKIRVAGKNGFPKWANQPAPSKEELIEQAENEKQQRLIEAESHITILERKVKLGVATESDLNRLTEWEIYSIRVADTDTSLAPNIEWAQQPR
ncbi:MULTISPECIES: tail fiber assembly protein [Providencia]|jgi:hypothetical protein|uniref:tail fiber assembly protein n=1 Tax=Providencia TaxID=586 RepID=UPI000BD56C32|nr:tail fiber assembly protein [Providencia rettgeri]ELR5066313.1 tail fiber assembly protein [Providencia rettgeri]PCQ37223.1 phage tail protein [Providencia rettgeri]